MYIISLYYFSDFLELAYRVVYERYGISYKFLSKIFNYLMND